MTSRIKVNPLVMLSKPVIRTTPTSPAEALTGCDRTRTPRCLPTARQAGKKHEQAKPLRGFGSAGVLEFVEDWDRNSYRAVYTVRFEGVVFVLHVFQKKSTRGVAAPKADIELIRERLKPAEQIAKELSR